MPTAASSAAGYILFLAWPHNRQPQPGQQQEQLTQCDQSQSQSSSRLISGQQTSSSISASSPADVDATVAAPATQVRTSGNHAQAAALLESQSTTHPQHHANTRHEDKRSSCGGRLKSMLSTSAAVPINSFAHKLGSQNFLPKLLGKECEKRLLRFSELFAVAKVISKAVGLVIFTTFRVGFQISGATGSGVLIACLPDGSWGPPSGISVHSLGTEFQIGLDIYDYVCVINSKEALSALTNTRVSLGSDLAVAAGPYGAGGAVDFGTAV
ncbi:hypothetical protein E4U21_002346 [Claviceps maximensis]|nr:hypothetical protein E4U21_002346 [Claviceps maximensis]